MKYLLAALCVALCAMPAFASDRTDTQVRIPIQFQHGAFAGWLVLQDATSPEPFRTLALAGLRLQDGRGTAQLMGGGVLRADGSIEPVLDVRLFYRIPKKLTLFFEVFHNLETERTVLLPQFTLHRGVWLYGGEAELAHVPEQPWQLVAGPKVGRRMNDHLIIAAVVLFQEGGNRIQRTYLAWTF